MKFNFIKIAVVLTISLIFSSQSYGSKYENCKDLRVIEDTRKLKTNEYKHFDRETRTSDAVKIFNKDARFNIKKYKIIFRKLGDTRLWEQTGSFNESITINRAYPSYVYISKDTTEIVEVNVWGLPYDKCFAYYTKQELRNIEIAKQEQRTFEAESKILQAEQRKIKKEKQRIANNKKRNLELKRKKLQAKQRKIREEKQRIANEKQRKLASERKVLLARERKVERKIEAIEKKRSEYIQTKQTIIYENCIIDKLDPSSIKELEKVIISNCKRISKKPNRWEQFWYDKYDELEPPKRGLMNIIIQNLDEDLANSNGLKNSSRVLISSATKNGAAFKAGIRSGDIVLKLNNILLKKIIDFSEESAELLPGTSVPIEIWRKGKTLNFNIIIGSKDIPS